MDLSLIHIQICIRDRREMIWSLKTQNDYLQNFISFSQKYASEFFSKSKINIHFVNNTVENLPLHAEIRRNIFLCYKEALNNIYKPVSYTHLDVYKRQILLLMRRFHNFFCIQEKMINQKKQEEVVFHISRHNFPFLKILKPYDLSSNLHKREFFICLLYTSRCV